MRTTLLSILAFLTSITLFGKNSLHQQNFNRDTIIEELSYYRNKVIKSRVVSYFDTRGIEYKTIIQSFRKDGKQRNGSVFENGQIQYYAKYTKTNQLKFEKTYYYNFKGYMVGVETKKDGERKYQNFDMDMFGDPYQSQ